MEQRLRAEWEQLQEEREKLSREKTERWEEKMLFQSDDARDEQQPADGKRKTHTDDEIIKSSTAYRANGKDTVLAQKFSTKGKNSEDPITTWSLSCKRRLPCSSRSHTVMLAQKGQMLACRSSVATKHSRLVGEQSRQMIGYLV